MDDFTISHNNWSFYRKSAIDQARHNEKISEVIAKNLPDLIGELDFNSENSSGNQRLVMKELLQHKVVFNRNLQECLGMSQHNLNKGDHVNVGESEGTLNPSKGGGANAGNEPGNDWYETNVNIIQMEEYLFKELELPDLNPMFAGSLVCEKEEWNDIASKGLRSQVDKKRTMLGVLKKNALAGSLNYEGCGIDDLRYRTWTEIKKPMSRALVMMMMDTSGSMGVWEKAMARGFFFWAKRFLLTKYDEVDFEFIAHHTEAKIVNEHEFFTKGESGGTICSSVYRSALDLIDEKYDNDSHNIYAYHFTDGDNLTSDNERCYKLIAKLSAKVRLFGCGCVNQYNRSSPFIDGIASTLAKKNPIVKHFTLRNSPDIYRCLKTFFPKRSD